MKAFIGFYTPSYDDSGIYHVIEHCIMAGSIKNKYENISFANIVGNINACTGCNYTCFMCESLSDEFFDILFNIMIDCIFHPKFLEDREIFERERVIVHNEMLRNNPVQSFFMHATGFEISGGLPNKILELSYEEVIHRYKERYLETPLIYAYVPDKYIALLNNEVNGTFTSCLEYEGMKVFGPRHCIKLPKVDINPIIISQDPVRCNVFVWKINPKYLESLASQLSNSYTLFLGKEDIIVALGYTNNSIQVNKASLFDSVFNRSNLHTAKTVAHQDTTIERAFLTESDDVDIDKFILFCERDLYEYTNLEINVKSILTQSNATHVSPVCICGKQNKPIVYEGKTFLIPQIHLEKERLIKLKEEYNTLIKKISEDIKSFRSIRDQFVNKKKVNKSPNPLSNFVPKLESGLSWFKIILPRSEIAFSNRPILIILSELIKIYILYPIHRLKNNIYTIAIEPKDNCLICVGSAQKNVLMSLLFSNLHILKDASKLDNFEENLFYIKYNILKLYNIYNRSDFEATIRYKWEIDKRDMVEEIEIALELLKEEQSSSSEKISKIIDCLSMKSNFVALY